MNRIIAIILVLLNFIGFIMAGVDKKRAIKNMWRIPEKRFFIVSIIGGFFGVYAGFLVFRHKTKHLKFMLGLPLIFMAQLIILFTCIKLV